MMISKVARRFIFSAALVIACCTVSVAQDSGQVLRVSVGYGTMKNTPSVMAKLTPEARAEVDRLGGLARTANGEGKYGDALKHLYHAMALMRGAEWTPARALGSALTVKLDRAMLDPGDKLAIRIGQMYVLDEKVSAKLAGSISLLKLRGDETVKDLKILDSIDPDFIAHPLSTEVVVPDVEAGNYRIAVRIQIAGGEPIVKNTTVHIERGLAADFTAAKARAAKTQESLKAKRDALVAAVPSAEYRISLFELAGAGEINFDRLDFRAMLKEATSMLDALDTGNDPFASRRGEFKKAYRSKVDSTLQPYQVFVPAGYDKSKTFPLVIALHGMGGDENSYFQAYAQGAFKLEAEKRGYIVACPKGRKPASMYIGDAEKDVMDVIAEVRRDYNVDPDRIYLTGHSMGGFGTWSVAMNHPDVFAALAPVSGGGANSEAMMAKIAHVPQLVVHGDNDPTVPVERSRVMVATGKKVGTEIKYVEVPGGDHANVVVPNFPAVFDWFDTHKRKRTAAAAAGASKNR